MNPGAGGWVAHKGNPLWVEKRSLLILGASWDCKGIPLYFITVEYLLVLDRLHVFGPVTVFGPVQKITSFLRIPGLRARIALIRDSQIKHIPPPSLNKSGIWLARGAPP